MKTNRKKILGILLVILLILLLGIVVYDLIFPTVETFRPDILPTPTSIGGEILFDLFTLS
jgi:hypothetical protein